MHCDMSVISELQELLEEGFGELVERFEADGATRLARMENALATGAAEMLYQEAHGLKGSSRNLGAGVLGNLCADLESLGQAANLAAARPIFAAAQTEFAACCAELRAL